MRVRELVAVGGFVMMAALAGNARAQWQPNDPVQTGDIHYDGGKVGIGTTPSNVLHIFKASASGTQVQVDNSTSSGYTGLLLSENGTQRALVAMANSSCTTCRGGSLAMQIWNSGNGPMLFGTNGSERMRLSASGFAGIGTTSPMQRLQVAGSIVLNNDADHSALNNGFFLFDDQVGTYGTTNYGITLAYNSTSSRYRLMTLAADNGDFAFASHPGGVLVTSQSNFTERFTIRGDSGYVGIGNPAPAYKLDVTGSIHATGNISADGIINAKYQDLAEWVPSATHLAAGTVVILDPTHTNQVAASQRQYDTTVAGVVSAQPGLVLGQGSDDKAMVATTGRVRVKVDARRKAIAIGDLLVTSDLPGAAMKSEPVEMGGIAMHRPGTIIGKALEPLQSGEGEILVLLALQ